ncbi:Ger(x)C family spore germination protein [Neobacillus mesonae]|uniref:Ger(x)C family spore germination protein n=1 Tax=Neobacillus mesonae TaxID=1193713 RepID=UPI0020407C15|nr:Ger(x)C family spore germination protein [Neobacillus mesonae]MCM3567132.1 Ger(x)C family spore germination protein [Neobacillus mesonae]
MKKLKIAMICFVIFSAIFFGRVTTQIVDDVNMASAVGYDYAGGDRVKLTTVVPVFKPDKSVGNKTYAASDELSKETLRKLNQSSSRKMVNGKLEVAVYSKELAERGIGDIVDTLERDPSISERLLVAIVDGDAEQLLKEKYGDRDTGVFLSMLIDQNIDSGLVPTYNFHNFLNNYYSKLSDPFLPLIQKNGKYVQIKGIALFKDGRYIQNLKQEHQFVFKALLEKLKLVTYKLKLDEDAFVAIEDINTRHKVRVKKIKGKPEVTVELTVKGIIRESKKIRTSEAAVERIRKGMEKQLEDQADEMIRTFQKAQIDPLGFGHEVRSRMRGFDYKKWLEQYPNLKIKVKTQVDILEKGVIE